MLDYLIATDAIGMGLNMDINEIYFSSKKFDGKKTRRLNLVEMSQIQGRAEDTKMMEGLVLLVTVKL